MERLKVNKGLFESFARNYHHDKYSTLQLHIDYSNMHGHARTRAHIHTKIDNGV